MSGGFPVRPDRDALGPTPKNRHPVRDPERELDADIGDLMMWILSAAGVMLPKARAHITVDGATSIALISAAEAWDPNGTYDPAPSYDGVGEYSLAYPATANDKNGDAQAVTFEGVTAHIAEGSLGGAPPNVVDAFLEADGRTITLRVYDNTDAQVNPPVGTQITVLAW